MSGEDDNASDKFKSYKDEEFIPEAQDIEGYHRDLVGKSSDTRNHARIRRTPQDRLLKSKSSSSLKKIKFSDKEFPSGTLVSDIIYDHPVSQNNNLFYLFYNQLNYVLAYYFAESGTTQNNIDKFLSDLLMAPLTKKLSYQNIDK